MKSLSRVRLFATPWTVPRQAPLSMGFSRQEYWTGLPFPSPGHLPNPGIESASLASSELAGRLYSSATWEAETRVRSLGRKIPWRRAWQSSPVFLPGESHGQRSLVGYSPWGLKSQTQLKLMSTALCQTDFITRVRLINVYQALIMC